MKRRRAREYALQMLFQLDLTNSLHIEPHALRLSCFSNFWETVTEDKEVRDFANSLVLGTIEHIDEIDSIIRQSAAHWSIERMAVVDRNILRAAAYELLYRKDIPSSATINEAIEIAKKYGTEESYAFINGILDKIRKTAVTKTVISKAT
ncbi:MAG: transcription antitermination factor NusB, partial [Nitrospirae bacterium]|nr:transcription antitermination factor NusB [Nitrospirota bacterium]